MRKIWPIAILIMASVLFVSLSSAFALGESRIGRGGKGGSTNFSLPGRLSRGNLLPSLGSPGSEEEESPGFSSFSSSVNADTQAPSNTQTGTNASSSGVAVPLNLDLNLSLFGISIDGQDILQGNALTSEQLVLLSQSATADLVALNVATIVQNNFQIGINVNFSPMITVVFADNSWTVVTETPGSPGGGEDGDTESESSSGSSGGGEEAEGVEGGPSPETLGEEGSA
ncbi:MAG: hypothetical protein H5U36_09220 [Candidatus Caldatribacterium sp.]|nr:hypothetical protein [Candidatus Caldatribacterium sp.]